MKSLLSEVMLNFRMGLCFQYLVLRSDIVSVADSDEESYIKSAGLPW